MTDTITVEGDQIRNLFAMTPYFWKTPHAGALRLAAKQSLTTEIGFRFLLTAGYNGTKSKGNTA